MLLMLFILLVIFLLLCNIECHRDFICPAFIFVGVFCFTVLWTLMRANDWNFELQTNTFLVIFFGVLLFILTCWFVKVLKRGNDYLHRNKQTLCYIHIARWKVMVLILFEVATIFLTLYFIITMYSSSWALLGDAIWQYKYNYTSENGIFKSIPGYVAYMRTLTDAIGYYVEYVFINNWLVKKKLDKPVAVVLILSVVSGITTGSRGWALNLVIGFVACIIILMGKRDGRQKELSGKLLIRIIVIMVAILFTYQGLGTLLGADTSSMSFMDYISMYCGAGTVNLDYFLNEVSRPKSTIFGAQTLIYVVKWIGPMLGIDTSYRLDMPFLKINGYEMGNIYTTFYPFVYDFGYIGIVVFTVIMAFILQSVYERVKRCEVGERVAMPIVLYSYMFSTVVFSFFSNKFYETIFTPNFLIYLICWYLLDFLVVNIHIGGRFR